MTRRLGPLLAVIVSLVAGFYAGQWHAEERIAPGTSSTTRGFEHILSGVFSGGEEPTLAPADDIEAWTIDKLDQFWSTELTGDYTEIVFESYDSSSGDWPTNDCGLTTDKLRLNAYFCGGATGEPVVVADRAFYEQHGDDSDATNIAAITVLAHEWGHYVSHLRGGGAATTVSLREELQADCFAGMFVNWLAETRGVSVETVERGAEVLFDIGDRSLTAWTARGRHGTPEQRLQAFRDGQMAQLHGNDLVECELYQRYRGESQGLGDGLELLLPPTSNVEHNEEKDKYEVVAPGQVYVEVALRDVEPTHTPEAALAELRPGWFEGSDVTFVNENSSSRWSLSLYEQVHPTYGPMHGALLALRVPDDATKLVVVDRYQTGPGVDVETNLETWRQLVDSAYAYARSVEPIG